MREIEFRGKWQRDGNWKYGFLYRSRSGYSISDGDGGGFAYMVFPESVGQYTGLKDKNGVKIFEGDIVKSTSCMDETYVGEVNFRDGEWLLDLVGDDWYALYRMQDYENGPTLEVIGNIHDNPELLEARDEKN